MLAKGSDTRQTLTDRSSETALIIGLVRATFGRSAVGMP